ncbi:hypothetical protein OGAPHI_007235 [Ogataea philodendri]|uniref:Uncharacterized protein n=1 Tax=Ogataea philodendri TaxID=1378263 RepID=A0A9P8NUM4_9ASCO|nr:uncharacterized protein OGAPHI_007235 [Ogataea philodendri]KAH3660030.1 hypothetical protein OGAPHI_007235 [Ogataea philodendri]
MRALVNSASVGAVTRERTVDVRTIAIDSRAISSLDLDIVVRSILVVRVWNQRKVSVSVSVTGTENQWSPVTDTGTFITPDATILNRNTGVVDIVLSGSLSIFPVVVAVLFDNTERLLRTTFKQSWHNHVFGTWVVSSAESNRVGNLRLDTSGLLTPRTQVVGIRVGLVQYPSSQVEEVSPSSFMTEAHPPNPSQSRETTPFPDGKSEHLIVPSWNSSEGFEKSERSPSMEEEPVEEDLEEDWVELVLVSDSEEEVEDSEVVVGSESSELLVESALWMAAAAV